MKSSLLMIAWHRLMRGPEEAVGDRIVGEHKEGFCGSSAKKDKRWAMLLKKHQMSDTGHVPKKILRCFGGCLEKS
ncbi:uncharacterized protein LOC131255920 isoform X5 [Magnolia sinica]|uniref:uncharacterized protein LOC131255920 isoform X5 n=1 Tax=Magnolia sinica TaxID=86752 RepID=UPI002659AD60|nr:uncharacterized protein LOC131255920 isoform X5 [Magnolia sinica]